MNDNSQDSRSSGSFQGTPGKSSIPDLPPLPDITDTSYMSSPFKAPPRLSHSVKDASDSVETAGQNSAQVQQSGPSTAVSAAAEDQIALDVKRNVAGSSTAASNGNSAASDSTASEKNQKSWSAWTRHLDEDRYKAVSEQFLASYRNPLSERPGWDRLTVKIPFVWFVLLFLGVFATASIFIIIFFFDYLVTIPHLRAIPIRILVPMVLGIACAGWLLNFLLIRKPFFWNKFHTVYAITCLLWGFGGVAGISSIVMTGWFDLSFLASDKNDLVSLIVPISLWLGFIMVIPAVLFVRLLPRWARWAPVIRLGILNTYWGAYAGIIVTLLAPYIRRDDLFQALMILLVSILPTAGIFTVGVAVSLPVRWPIPLNAYLNHLLGMLMVAFGAAVLISFVLASNIGTEGRVLLAGLVLLLSFAGLWALLGISRAPDPLRRGNLQGLQVWSDADVISYDEQEFMCDESTIAQWVRASLRRGVFLAARDYYRAVMRLAFTDFEDENAHILVNTVRVTRRKLEAAGIPPRTDFEDFSEVPIFPDVVN